MGGLRSILEPKIVPESAPREARGASRPLSRILKASQNRFCGAFRADFVFRIVLAPIFYDSAVDFRSILHPKTIKKLTHFSQLHMIF